MHACACKKARMKMFTFLFMFTVPVQAIVFGARVDKWASGQLLLWAFFAHIGKLASRMSWGILVFGSLLRQGGMKKVLAPQLC